jgi:hypothetical protein
MGSEISKMGRIIDFSRQGWNHYFVGRNSRFARTLGAVLALLAH